MIHRLLVLLLATTLLAACAIPKSESRGVDAPVPAVHSRDAVALADLRREFWIIAAPNDAALQRLEPPRLTTADGRQSLPVEALAVHADVHTFLASVTVKQTFVSPASTPADFRLTFTLPESSVIRDFTVTLGPREIRGVVRPLEEAKRLHQLATERGLRSSLITQAEGNSFVQTLTNVQPHHPIQTSIAYVQVLPFADGAFHLALPTRIADTTTPKVVPLVSASVRGKGITHVSSETHPVRTRAGLDPLAVVVATDDTSKAVVLRCHFEPAQADIALCHAESTNDTTYVATYLPAHPGDAMLATIQAPGVVAIVPPQSVMIPAKQSGLILSRHSGNAAAHVTVKVNDRHADLPINKKRDEPARVAPLVAAAFIHAHQTSPQSATDAAALEKLAVEHGIVSPYTAFLLVDTVKP